jgi:CPA2 family monovalent cation:H+ antiporter-2
MTTRAGTLRAVHELNAFLPALATVLGVAAVTTVLFRKLGQPVVLGYLLAGLIIGPHVPIPLVADPGVVQTLSELGVILLMFSIGMEFSLKKLLKVGVVSGIIALTSASLLIWMGFSAGQLLGWTVRESIFGGAIVSISSTTIVIRAFNEKNVQGKLREVVVGVLIAQDLIAIVMLATLTALASGGVDARELLITTGKLAAFLVGLVVVGLLTVPRAIRAIAGLHQHETTLVASVGLCFGFALLALRFGYSVALGAFIAGSLIAESGEARHIEKLVEPVRDVLATVFFVSVGMLINPVVLFEQWPAVLVFTAVVLVGQSVSTSLGAFLTGNGIRTSVQAGMSLAQIGEFSFIIAGLGLSTGATGAFLSPLAIAVSVITTFTTPWMIKASDPVARFIDRKLPPRLQTLSSLYQSWVETLRTTRATSTQRTGMRRYLQLLVVDAGLLAGVLVGAGLAARFFADSVAHGVGVSVDVARAILYGGAAATALPLSLGVVRIARRMAQNLATRVLPDVEGGTGLDRAAAPRRALVVTLQLAVVLAVGVPLLALTRPFLPGAQGAVVLLMLVVFLSVGFWRSAANLEGHVRAGAHVIVEALRQQSRADASLPPVPGPASSSTSTSTQAAHAPDHPLAAVHALLPGIGDPSAVQLEPTSAAVGQSLRSLNLRGMTGATVLALVRDGQGVLVPSASDPLRGGDTLALVGSSEAIAAARALLLTGPPAEPVVDASVPDVNDDNDHDDDDDGARGDTAP